MCNIFTALEAEGTIIKGFGICPRGGAVADLGGAQGARAPPRAPKFFRFHAVFGKIWQNRMLAPPLGVGATPGKILDPPLRGYASSQHASLNT